MTKAKHDSSKNMRTFNNDLIRSFNPCYDPIKYFKDDEKLNALVVLDNEKIPFSDVLWLLMREEFVSEKLMRLFAIWCARQVQNLMKDERSLKALDVAEKFVIRSASLEEFETARDTAKAAAWDAAENALVAAKAAAWDAAENAWVAVLDDASWDTAWTTADNPAGIAARATAKYAARAAAWDAEATFGDAAWNVALNAAQASQRAKLREMILKGIETGDTK